MKTNMHSMKLSPVLFFAEEITAPPCNIHQTDIFQYRKGMFRHVSPRCCSWGTFGTNCSAERVADALWDPSGPGSGGVPLGPGPTQRFFNSRESKTMGFTNVLKAEEFGKTLATFYHFLPKSGSNLAQTSGTIWNPRGCLEQKNIDVFCSTICRSFSVGLPHGIFTSALMNSAKWTKIIGTTRAAPTIMAVSLRLGVSSCSWTWKYHRGFPGSHENSKGKRHRSTFSKPGPFRYDSYGDVWHSPGVWLFCV